MMTVATMRISAGRLRMPHITTNGVTMTSTTDNMVIQNHLSSGRPGIVDRNQATEKLVFMLWRQRDAHNLPSQHSARFREYPLFKPRFFKTGEPQIALSVSPAKFAGPCGQDQQDPRHNQKSHEIKGSRKLGYDHNIVILTLVRQIHMKHFVAQPHFHGAG